MPAAAPWNGLHRELDRWASEGRTARLWLRDDDAIEASGSLDRMLDITAHHGVPMLLAVIPRQAKPDLVRRLESAPHVTPCQHGCFHRNHAAPDQKKQELGDHRPLAVVLEDLRQARDRLADLFGTAAHPVLVPPWNRIAASVVDHLPGQGFETMSAFGRPPPAIRIRQVNCDLDIVDWKRGRRGRDPAALFTELTAILANARRDGGRPVGILTHHLVHDCASWSFLKDLFTATEGHSAAEWVSFGRLANIQDGYTHAPS